MALPFLPKESFCACGLKVVSCLCWFCCNVDNCCFQMQALISLISAHCQSPVNESANAAGKEGFKVQIETTQTVLTWGDQDLHSALQILDKSRAVSDRSQHPSCSAHPLIEKLIITPLTIGSESFCGHRSSSGLKEQLGFGLVC